MSTRRFHSPNSASGTRPQEQDGVSLGGSPELGLNPFGTDATAMHTSPRTERLPCAAARDFRCSLNVAPDLDLHAQDRYVAQSICSKSG